MTKLTKITTTAFAALGLASAGLIAQDAAIENRKDALLENNSTVADVAMDNENFTTLVTAIKAADLADTLKGDGPFTVFAPTNEAFEKLPEGTVEDLLKPENKDKLRSILTYHVVPGKLTAAEATNSASAETVNGEKLVVKTSNAGVIVNDANVTMADIDASNGVVHAIDTVLMP